MIVIPFSIMPISALKLLSKYYLGLSALIVKNMPYLNLDLNRANMDIEDNIYVSYCLSATTILFILLSVVFAMVFSKFTHEYIGVITAAIFCIVILLMQLNYPSVIAKKRTRKVDLELLASLRTMIIQLNSGLPLFE